MQKPEALPGMAWCRPPQKFTPWAVSPCHTARATSSDPAAILALASCIPTNAGSSSVPSPRLWSATLGSSEAARTAAT